MNRAINPRHINLFEAVKYDIRLHGARFIILEFAAAGLGATAIIAWMEQDEIEEVD